MQILVIWLSLGCCDSGLPVFITITLIERDENCTKFSKKSYINYTYQFEGFELNSNKRRRCV